MSSDRNRALDELLMTTIGSSSLQRQRFLDPLDTSVCSRVLQLLLAQDGSTTRLCEVVAGGPVELHLIEQRIVEIVPPAVRATLCGTTFIERISSLTAHGQVLTDNLAYIAVDGLPTDVQDDLKAGKLPIGHLLSRLWVRRRFFDLDMTLLERLWSVAGGTPDPEASRLYCIDVPEGPRMMIAETFRRGMLMEHTRPQAVAA